MENSKQTIISEAMCDEELTIEGTKFYVYYDYTYQHGEPDVGVDGGYEVEVRAAFDESGMPVTFNERQTQLAEWTLSDRLKDRGGK